MPDSSSVHPGLSENAIVRACAEHAARRITRKVISALQRRTETTSGDDSELKTLWDEVCAQVQYEESILWDAYDQTVRAFVEACVEELAPHEQEALWLQTDAGIEWTCEASSEREAYPVSHDEIADFIVLDYVYAAAGSWSNARIRAFIDRSTMRD